MPAHPPPAMPNNPPMEIIQSTETNPLQNVLQARKERDGSWTITVATKAGEINRLVIPAEKGGCLVDFRALPLDEETQAARISCKAGDFYVKRVR